MHTLYNTLAIPSENLHKALAYKEQVIIMYNDPDFIIIETNCPSKTLATIVRIVKETPIQDCPTDTLMHLLNSYNYATSILVDSTAIATYEI